MSLTKNIKFLLVLTIIFFSFNRLSAQCCSAGSPVGATVNVGILDKGMLRVSAFYRHNVLDNYFTGTDKNENYSGKISTTNFNYTNLNIAYGLTHRMSIEVDAGYFLNKTQILKDPVGYVRKGFGFSAATINLKYCLYNDLPNQFEATAGVGFKIPLATELQYDGSVPLPVEIQPSTGAYGYVFQLFFNKGFSEHKFRIFNINRIEYNQKNKFDYRYGAFMINSLFFSKQIIDKLAFVLEFRNEWKQQDKEVNIFTKQTVETINTGNHNIIVSPRLSYSFKNAWFISALYDIPVYRNYIGTQMALDYSFAFSISKNIKL